MLESLAYLAQVRRYKFTGYYDSVSTLQPMRTFILLGMSRKRFFNGFLRPRCTHVSWFVLEVPWRMWHSPLLRPPVTTIAVLQKACASMCGINTQNFSEIVKQFMIV